MVAARLTAEQAKALVVEAIGKGHTIVEALEAVSRSRKTYENWRSVDKDFADKIDRLRTARKTAVSRDRDPDDATLDFEGWRKKFLNRETYPHQRQWIAVLEGRELQTIHPNITYQPGRPQRVLINTPPFHAKALALDTEVPTPHGWTTIGQLREGDEVFGLDGKPTRIVTKSEVFDKPCFRVEINDGESFVACEDHLWRVAVTRNREETLSTRQLFERGGRFNLPLHDALSLEGVDLPLDPYVLGAWLGDGHTASGRFTTADPETLGEFRRAGFDPHFASNNGSAANTYEVPGLFRALSEIGVRGCKFVPDGYLFADYDHRLALLQGLMDTDGTVSNESQCSFTNTNRALAEGVLFLASSLGLRPTIKEGRATLNGADCGPKWTVWFASAGVPVFRLPRKLAKVRATKGRRGGAARRIVSVAPVETVPTQCIEVDNDSHLFLIGRSLVPTHNSTVITQEYATYRICMNPNIRICIVAKTQQKAKKFLHSIKRMLTGPQYAELQAAYAPGPEGFKDKESSWTATHIYVAGRDNAEKDPTVEVLGIRGDIYGGRYDLIILDDCVTKENCGEWDKQLDWINQEVASRVYGGKILVVGTRISPVDLYSELMNGDNFTSGKSVWTRLAQPAVLEFAEDPKNWKTLWPRSNAPLDEEDPGEPDENGEYAAWDGPALSDVRDSIKLSTWSLVYMQADVPEDAIFNPVCVRGSIEARRKPGLLKPGAWGHPRTGMEGQYVIASMDPAMTQDTFTLVGAVDKKAQMRRILNCWVKTSPTPAYIRELIYSVTDEYQVNEWVIEKNAFQLFLIHDEEIQKFCRTRGVRITEQYTSKNKQDPDFGVASVAPLFGSIKQHESNHRAGMDHAGDNLIELPDPAPSEGVRALIEQLVTWQPGKLGKDLKQDGPMALWFFELRARAILGQNRKTNVSFVKNPYLSRGDRRRQVVIPFEAYRDVV